MSAARVLARVSVVPALLLVAWLAASLPLLLAGIFRPVPAIALFAVAAAAVLWFGLRAPHDAPGGEADQARPVSWWAAGGVLAVGVVFLVFQVVMNAEQIIVRRDPASYMQFAIWLKEHGSLPIPQMRWAFGGGDPALSYESPAFYQRGDDIIPQFMAGLPLILALGGWIGGTHGMLLMAPLLGACAVVAFGGLTARLVGPNWAPLGAAALALSLPMLWVSRSTYSELPALVLLLGGLALLHDARRRQARAQAFLGGLALGLIVLVRIDALRDVLPVVVFAGLLVGRGRRTGWPLGLGLAIGAGAGLVEGFVLSRPYLRYLHASLNPLLAMAAALVGAALLMAVALRWEVTGRRLRRAGAAVARGRLPDVAAALTVPVVVAFAARPLLQTVRREPHNADDRLNVHFIEQVQRINHLPVDGTRQYSELSYHWVVWYIGVPAALLAAFGAALLVRRLLRGRSPEWVLPFAVLAWTTVTTLLRPAITPDHPWASRRLVAVVIPGMLLLALWAADWGLRRVRRAGHGPRAVRAFAAGAAVLVLAPIVVTSAGFMAARTEQGEVAAVRGMCERIGPKASVVLVERATADRFTQVVRGMCGLPAARTVPDAGPGDVARIVRKIYDAGRRPVLLGGEAANVAPYGRAVHVLELRTRQDQRTLTRWPTGTWSLTVNVWMAVPARP
ncbi:hypothetical protein Acsp04_06020 [Actinomadura sp. NBRC 104425]|uniref:hypothetical protein n=1 Tax=Actinomadura sp. NBRC 104425 TaxID=3032204 RepID=UPI0024A16968|nr:hypothetical protein [Actinomadura sp. NBRC 104425]GLZ10367.1 hypothetical protein Acsp04_06020 [Actinomadura sp. NBRC 104425]